MARKQTVGYTKAMREGTNLAKKFSEISKNVETEVEQALVISALIVERDAKLNCPVDSGRLRQSITHRLVDENGNSVAEVGTNVEYAKMVEFGTSKAPSQPFLFPAYNNNKQRILRELAKAFKKGCGL
jgi:HK97 gp10 family phage protein